MTEETVQAEVLATTDFGLTSNQLEAKYGIEHTTYTRGEWRDEVGNGDTQLGYWDWALHQVESGYSGDCDLCGKRDCDKTFTDSGYICQECVSAESAKEHDCT